MREHEPQCLMKYGIGEICTCNETKQGDEETKSENWLETKEEKEIREQREQDKQIIVAFDATELDNFQSCKQKWNLFHHRHIVPKTTKTYLETGSLLHYLLELYYKQKRDGFLIIGENQSFLTIEDIIEQGRIKSLDFNIELEEASQIYFQFREYCRHYEDENLIPIHVEEPFMHLLHEDEEIKIYLTGKPDLIFRYPNSNSKVVLDHKKVSRESEISQIRNQFMLYATAMGSDTVIVNKIGFQKTKKPNERFNRVPFSYSQELLDEWKEETIADAKLMVLHEQLKSFPHNRSSCEKWDGCFYRRYCTTRPKARDFLIGSEYVIVEQWDPSKRLEK